MVPEPTQSRTLPEDFNMDFSQRLVIDTRRLDWLRSPHLSEHFPYVEEETVILVKTGHLPVQDGR